MYIDYMGIISTISSNIILWHCWIYCTICIALDWRYQNDDGVNPHCQAYTYWKLHHIQSQIYELII